MGKSLGERIQEAEKTLKQKLEETNLVKHIRFNYGSLKDKNNALFLEYEVNTSLPDYERERKCRELFVSLYKILTTNNPEILEIKIQPCTFKENQPLKYKAILKIEHPLKQKKDFIFNILSQTNSQIQSYLQKY